MTESGHVWIVTEQALNANNTPDGVLGLQLVYSNSEKEHIRVYFNDKHLTFFKHNKSKLINLENYSSIKTISYH